MLKKLLCVMISALMVISVLPVSAMAAIYSITTVYNDGSTENGTYAFNYTDYCSSFSAGDELEITVELVSDSGYFGGAVGGNTDDDNNYNWASSSFSGGGSTTLTVTLTVTAKQDSTTGWYQSGDVKLYWTNGTYLEVNSISIVNKSASTTPTTPTTPTTSTSSTTRFIYVNEDYHALIINGHFICIPHTVNANGVCTVCKEYVGGEETEASTTTIDGVEYEEAYTVDVSLGSSNGWGQLDLGDTALIDALSEEGAILVITRDGVSDTVHNGSETYEKFGLVNSWWSGTWIALGTAGHTSATEEGTIDCISDDGTTVIYDGATVYAEWVSRGMTAGGTVELISNTSNSLKITNVTVYVPAGTVVTETVDVTEPVEDTNTETEDDELDVDDTDAEEVTETNPTTGVVLALVPMAIAGFAVVASKRR